jgi:hypothetical protein
MVLGWLAALFFAIAFIFNGAGVHSGAWLTATSFALLGLVCLALHLLGVGPAAPVIVHRRAPGE